MEHQVARRVTIADVAEAAGVSKTAVSFAFNNPTRLNVDTASRIMAIADELGYRPDPVAFRQGGEDRLIPAATDDLDLAAGDEGSETLDEGRSLGADPRQERPRVVEREPDRGVALEGLEHRQVGPVERLGYDPTEVANGLVVVERQGEGNSTRHASPRCLAAALEGLLESSSERLGTARSRDSIEPH